MQFEIISKNPCKYTSDEILFQVYAERNNLRKEEYEASREQFFSKGQPCFRASPLTKRYGLGIHSDGNGKVAIFGISSKSMCLHFTPKLKYLPSSNFTGRSYRS